MGWEEQLGSIGVGKLADLIVVEKDPLQDLQLLRSPRSVFQHGRIVWDKDDRQAAAGVSLPHLHPSWMST